MEAGGLGAEPIQYRECRRERPDVLWAPEGDRWQPGSWKVNQASTEGKTGNSGSSSDGSCWGAAGARGTMPPLPPVNPLHSLCHPSQFVCDKIQDPCYTSLST